MSHDRPYVSKTANAAGRFNYTAEETSVWRTLFTCQMHLLEPIACEAFLKGQSELGLSATTIPQVCDVNAKLSALTGAGVEPVAALIPQDQFSRLLSKRRFPVATFIRRREHLDYIEEPDIFHEVFGHCPMLCDPDFCAFMERFGNLALTLPEDHVKTLFRLWWFTVEFGLIRENDQLKAFGAGIMSSPSEVSHVSAQKAKVLPFDLMTIFRTDYRIDIVQPVLFAIDSFEQLAASLDEDIPALIADARTRGDLPRHFDVAA
ncbi:MAG: phenylalanine 4-monooxygenase [Pseudomonadota bacterium]